MEDLFHYSAKEVPWPLDSSVYPKLQAAQDDFYKPIGFWVSPDTRDGWEAWCKEIDFRLDRLAVKSRVHIKPDAKILRITTSTGLKTFVDIYSGSRGLSAFAEADDSRPPCNLPEFIQARVIDWHRIYPNWDGILIIPNFNKFMFPHDTRFLWYYYWDCASGCIWNTDVIESIVAERKQHA